MLTPMPLFDVNNPKRGDFFVRSGKMARGTEYGPLLTDGFMYLCPDCGGYGVIHGVKECGYCKGVGEIALDDPRVLHGHS